jgi:indolepyruvate ferredoxin oxidoreductase
MVTILYAQQYASFVQHVAAREASGVPGRTAFSTAVARSLFHLMAYKDDYEVARLHSHAGFKERLKEQFEGPFKLKFHLAPPLFARRDLVTGLPRKKRFGSWIYPLFRVLAHGRRLRGTVFDVFGYTNERRNERAIIVDFETMISDKVLPLLSPISYAAAIELAELPQSIKGYGHIKENNRQVAIGKGAVLLESFTEAAKAGRASAPRTELVSERQPPEFDRERTAKS